MGSAPAPGVGGRALATPAARGKSSHGSVPARAFEFGARARRTAAEATALPGVLTAWFRLKAGEGNFAGARRRLPGRGFGGAPACRRLYGQVRRCLLIFRVIQSACPPGPKPVTDRRSTRVASARPGPHPLLTGSMQSELRGAQPPRLRFGAPSRRTRTHGPAPNSGLISRAQRGSRGRDPRRPGRARSPFLRHGFG